MLRPALLCLTLAVLPAAAAELVAPYVNSPQEDVEQMLEMADVGATDYLIDLGSGDGRIVITAAARRGAIGHGVELDPALVALARQRARDAGVADRAAFQHGDIFDADLTAASVVTLYLMPEVNLRLRPKLLAELAPGTRVLSNSFDMGDWRPDLHAPARTSGGILLWIVPARVAGEWTVTAAERRFTLTLTQRYQVVDATLRQADGELEVLAASLAGERLVIMAGTGGRRLAFSGRVAGDRMHGMLQIHAGARTRLVPWSARRVAAAES